MSTNTEDFNQHVHSDVVVIGANHHNTLGVIRSLGSKHINPIVIVITKTKDPYVKYSKFIKSYIQMDNGKNLMDILGRIGGG